ncbi:MAG: hypothetical protein JSW03_01950 [Candidatus Eiseniibacteriota bacterium]|nr:MAG: hypothetical protein JSW03_01950 [Candidatus Eisenbacteria bacterium]
MKRAFSILILITVSAACYCLAAQAGDPPCNGSVSAGSSGSTIVVHHDQAEWNCCAEIEFELSASQDTLNLYEFETFGEMGPCLCLCCFDLTTTIEDVPPGDYLVRVLNGLSGELFGEVWVTVTWGLMGEISLGGTAQSPCGGWTTSVEDPLPATTWGRVKTLYR